MIIHAGGEAKGICRDVIRADGRITVGAIATTEARAPGGPALFEGRRRGRLVDDRSVGKCDVGRQARLLALAQSRSRRRRHRWPDIGAAIDERIEHQFEKLVGQLDRCALGAGPGLAVDLGEAARAQSKECCRNTAGRVEEIGQRVGDVLLVDVKPGVGGESGFQVQINIVGVVAQVVAGALRQVAIGDACECGAAEPAGRGQDRVFLRHVITGGELRIHRRAGQRRGAGNVGAGGGRGRDLHEIDRAGLKREIAGDGERAGRVRWTARRERAARRHCPAPTMVPMPPKVPPV